MNKRYLIELLRNNCNTENKDALVKAGVPSGQVLRLVEAIKQRNNAINRIERITEEVCDDE